MKFSEDGSGQATYAIELTLKGVWKANNVGREAQTIEILHVSVETIGRHISNKCIAKEE